MRCRGLRHFCCRAWSGSEPFGGFDCAVHNLNLLKLYRARVRFRRTAPTSEMSPQRVQEREWAFLRSGVTPHVAASSAP
ncbi:hypothetical protein MPNT_170050 [Candidatus Methylacidithermus pantelleriae]|uniref:Uncharacterized protein n=1 Tax=Candidatus Methylacidithermus pantelleriae TaxID=2744239 RepID=A0A8J2BRT0_9BACT|nr:hypothetical protein MPNT_170050 [Candidatus Methylacidithermus pantelleriae]